MARWMGIDFGTVRVGIALADPEIGLASPYDVLRGGLDAAAVKITEIVAAEEVDRIIFGLPLSLRGIEGASARRARAFADKLAAALPAVSITFVDERFSTRAVVSARRERGAKRSKEGLDAAAAAWILQNYIESKKPMEPSR